jgi:hypothetical protein
MSEWWTYRPSDFLMFSPRAYWRLVELYQREVWPLQWVALAAGVGLLWLALRRSPAATRAICAVLALAWMWVGWAFHWQRYATINWGARPVAVAFAAQAALLLAFGVFAAGGRAPPQAAGLRGIGWVLAAAGLLAYPLVGVIAGRPWIQAELFGLMPDPTALATVGLLWAAGPRRRSWLIVIPLLWLTVGMGTLWLMSG